MAGELREMTPQEKYNQKIRDRYKKKKKSSKVVDDYTKLGSTVKEEDLNKLRESLTLDVAKSTQIPLSILKDGISENTPETIADEPTVKKSYLVSFLREIKPLIKGPYGSPIKLKRDYAVVEATTFKQARDDIRAAWGNKTLRQGGIGDIKVTELTPEQVHEYNVRSKNKKDREEALKDLDTSIE